MSVNKGFLYLVSTPIGNLEDITYRSVKILKEVDAILCEDTRETGKLLKYLEITKKMIACHEHNEDKIKSKVCDMLNDGFNIALVTDRGTPVISDPGYLVVKEVIKNNFEVFALPGPTAFVPALISSGIEPSPFLFYGFLNSKNSKREKELVSLSNYSATLIFYEAPHRIYEMLHSISKVLGNRYICITREITKLYEEKINGYIDDIIAEGKEIKGELVVIVEGNKETVKYDEMSIMEHINLYLEENSNVMDVIKIVAKERNVPKSVVYKEYHNKGERK